MELIENGRLKVLLEQDDLQQLDISFEEMDYGNMETKRVVWTLLDKARRQYDLNFDVTGKLLIEVIPNRVGGCVMYFTALTREFGDQSQRMIMKKSLKPLIYSFENASHLLSAIAGLSTYAKDCLGQSELYLYENTYKLILYPQGIENPALSATFMEFGKLHKPHELAPLVIREHGKALAMNEEVLQIYHHLVPAQG